MLLGYFQEAERRFDVEWEVLAAVMLIETRMGRIRSRSSAGRPGPDAVPAGRRGRRTAWEGTSAIRTTP